ncbi:20235_t:CDS:2 [Funneliformis geosporum]|uniref:969_t:CDS:1 n=1 Tax=Funneliformis geosporum TaxID=1117311 RepID=A0A9W4WP71_9GLOM|nr:20235_t:CDS:2 [Funneliformis geosporum]CAI2175936.1 969_t:CDS:2 [Funneliformis geosporum]
MATAESCFTCISYKAQLEQKEAIITKYQKIVQFQNELIQELSLNQKKTTKDTASVTTNDEAALTAVRGRFNRNYYRTYVGPLTGEVDKTSLKKCLEESFGPVDTIDFIPGKSCAFANFFSPTAYHNAISEGAIMVKGIVLSVEQAKKPRFHYSKKKSSLS